MKTVFKALAALLGLVLLSLLGLLGWNWAVLSTFPQMPSSYVAKEYCSCRWVSERPDEFCMAYVRQTTVPMQGHSVDEQARSVTATSLWQSNSAHFVDRQHGCVLDR